MMASRLSYANKVVLAPMVRISTLPTRLLALDYGADIVYCEEIIDFKMLQCKRIENELLGTVDYVWSDGTIVFRTHPREKDKLVFQIGTADAERALKVAQMIERDVAGIDINMGCPKEFSIKGGMGAALLTQPDKVKEILTTLVQGVSVPVTCKIRILPTIEETLELVKMIESTGVAAIAVHGRMRVERSRHKNHNDVIRTIAETVNVPIIANGGSREMKCFADVLAFQESCEAESVMVARAAQWNPSIFRREGMLPIDDVIRAYLKYALDYDSVVNNIKYCVQQIMHEQLDTPRGQALQASSSIKEICALFGMDGYHDEKQVQDKVRLEEFQNSDELKRTVLEDGTELVEMNFKFNRKNYPVNISPKLVLYEWTVKNKKQKPTYETEQNPKDRTFHSVVLVEGTKYASTLWDKSKKGIEQAAAAVCLKALGIHDGMKDYDAAVQTNSKLQNATSKPKDQKRKKTLEGSEPRKLLRTGDPLASITDQKSSDPGSSQTAGFDPSDNSSALSGHTNPRSDSNVLQNDKLHANIHTNGDHSDSDKVQDPDNVRSDNESGSLNSILQQGNMTYYELINDICEKEVRAAYVAEDS